MWRSTTQVLLTRAKPHCCANTVRTLFTGFGPTTNQYTTKILPTPRWRTIPHRTCVRMASRVPPMSWESLEQAVPQPVRDRVNGPTNSQATLRLFGRPKEEARVVLYRDYHAWCPYCQKVWLWLEEKQVPYEIRKVTMFCYGEKEQWYKRLVPSGMLPALAIDGHIITESDDILMALEQTFGALNHSMVSDEVIALRKLERMLFRAWCQWSCNPKAVENDDRARERFQAVAAQVDDALAATPGAYFLEEFGIADVVFTPYIERMAASLYYYKGYDIKGSNVNIGKWFAAMETRSTYLGTQSDYHTHAHDLPPQMGGCYSNNTAAALRCAQSVDQGIAADSVPESAIEVPVETASTEAIQRVLRHRDNLIAKNPCTDKQLVDVALRAVLTELLLHSTAAAPTDSDAAALGPHKARFARVTVLPPGCDKILRYVRDRISVPRDMSLHAARVLRACLETTAAEIYGAWAFLDVYELQPAVMFMNSWAQTLLKRDIVRINSKGK